VPVLHQTEKDPTLAVPEETRNKPQQVINCRPGRAHGPHALLDSAKRDFLIVPHWFGLRSYSSAKALLTRFGANRHDCVVVFRETNAVSSSASGSPSILSSGPVRLPEARSDESR